jgi:hypothetical protein
MGFFPPAGEVAAAGSRRSTGRRPGSARLIRDTEGKEEGLDPVYSTPEAIFLTYETLRPGFFTYHGF